MWYINSPYGTPMDAPMGLDSPLVDGHLYMVILSVGLLRTPLGLCRSLLWTTGSPKG